MRRRLGEGALRRLPAVIAVRSMAGMVGLLSGGWNGARRGAALTLALIALLLQINAPVHAALMQAGGPLAEICRSHPGETDQRKAPPVKAEPCAACLVCAVAGPALATVAALVLAAPAFVRIRRRLIPREAAPRGPPALVPRARGPPAYA